MADRMAFATQLDPNLLSAARSLADSEGRGIEAVIEEALADLLRKRASQPRPHIMAAFEGSIEKFGEVYRRLAD